MGEGLRKQSFPKLDVRQVGSSTMGISIHPVSRGRPEQRKAEAGKKQPSLVLVKCFVNGTETSALCLFSLIVTCMKLGL